MSSFIDNLTRKEWERFCEIMLRQHYGAKNFWAVPDEDCGDLGLEFYTVDGTFFQCYFPNKDVDMSTYKKNTQKKIRDDLGKLKENETKIKKLIDDVEVNQWVLLTPEVKSKDLISFCHKYKNKIKSQKISYINNDDFIVKIETADSYPEGKIYAQGVFNKAIDIPFSEVTDYEKDIWKQSNSKFSKDIIRKSVSLMGENSEDFQELIISKYIQIEKFFDQLREEHPDQFELIEGSGRAQLENMKEESFFTERDREFVKSIIKSNKNAFSKYSEFMSDQNVQSLAFGYLSKWFAQCYMDFK